ncbi:MAG TPA: CRISPR-associated protein Cas10 [Cyanobacteria bacterium UBA12227]|nr:CRISPR-associated protein Cas10 [Cyanobacteria bacterium UBA12227]HAX85327.1 CRISPR-associated protein Cas10 [Cyanobacteria bacterium UBA11370]HBY81750.1 CRISPR-associated protein Cas10 [Cyanobacteria bacterium UBA11148]
MNTNCYTVITFAPVQGFIEKSRKLRDLYGSSFLISYLAEAICKEAEKHGYKVISPALIKVTQGTPNQIILKRQFDKEFDKELARESMHKAWRTVSETCRQWIEDNVKDCGKYYWHRNWQSWGNYTWEFFWGSGDTISKAREAINEAKRSRDWIGINWTGESSTLSGADGVAWPGMGIGNPQKTNRHKQKQEIADFYQRLSYKLGEAFIETAKLTIAEDKLAALMKEYGEAFVDPDEELSIPELVKRLITHQAIANKIVSNLKEQIDPNSPHRLNILTKELKPDSFSDISRLKHKDKDTKSQESHEEKYWTGWFQGDGDRMGDLLKRLSQNPKTEPDELNKFSQAMMKWGEDKFKPAIVEAEGRTVYAGGDDFMGIFYRLPEKTLPNQEFTPLTGKECVNWFASKFPSIWRQHHQPITVSVGFVWTAPNVPQRDVLQHCRLAEKSAKDSGKDRMAIRILFNGGTHIEWVCPWWCLPVLEHYQDREGTKIKPNWTHIYNDVATLESRQAFKDNTQIAEALFKIYFPDCEEWIHKLNWWVNCYKDGERTGLLGHEAKDARKEEIELFNEWFINLAKVGFHLCR